MAGRARITVASDVSHGGYDGLEDVGIAHITVPGLQSRLNITHLWRGWCGLRRLLRDSDADIIWLHARLPVMLARIMLVLRLWRPRQGCTVAITYHGLPFGPGHPPARARVSRRMESVLLGLCPPLDLVFLTAGQAARMTEALGRLRMARHRVHVLPNSSDLGTFQSKRPRTADDSAPWNLVMTGRCGYQKNYPMALRLFAHLPETVFLTLCGSGTESAAFRAQAAAILSPEALARVRFAGPVRDVRPILADADAYLLTSRYEGLPIGALEAFEAGLPLVLSRYDGVEDLVAPHPLALVLDLKDLPADAARILDLLHDARTGGDGIRRNIQQAWQEHWSFQAFTGAAQRLFDQLLESVKRSGGRPGRTQPPAIRR